MLDISADQMARIATDARDHLRESILDRWWAALRKVGDEVGEAGRARVLAEIEALARDPAIPTADLMMLADLRLVWLAEEGLP